MLNQSQGVQLLKVRIIQWTSRCIDSYHHKRWVSEKQWLMHDFLLSIFNRHPHYQNVGPLQQRSSHKIWALLLTISHDSQWFSEASLIIYISPSNNTYLGTQVQWCIRTSKGLQGSPVNQAVVENSPLKRNCYIPYGHQQYVLFVSCLQVIFMSSQKHRCVIPGITCLTN